MIGTIQDYLRDMQDGVFDYTKDGKCSNCGQCCSDLLPVSDAEIRRIRRYVQARGIREHVCRYPTAKPVRDFTCPFRNNREKRCDIYEVRPAICRDFQCDKPKKQIWADREMYHGKYRAISMRATFFPKKTTKGDKT